jgi:hypothetical protein
MRRNLLVVQYIGFFVRRRQLLSLFGERVVEYALILLAVCGFLILSGGIGGADAHLFTRTLGVVLFLFLHCAALATLLSAHLTAAHTEYLEYLGFASQQIRFLIYVIAAPMCLTGSLMLWLITEGVLPLHYRFGALIATLVLSELASPALLWMRTQWKARRTSRRKNRRSFLATARSFHGPYRAFFQKDIRELRSLNGVLLLICLVMVDFAIMLFVIVEPSGWAYGICFSVALFFTSTSVIFTLFDCESTAYRDYYTRQLHLKDVQIIFYKLPLQALMVVCAATILAIFNVLVYGLTPHYLLIASGITAYHVAFCIPFSWWCIRRLRKGKAFNLLYGIASLVVFIFPGTVLLYALASIPTWRLSTASNPKHVRRRSSCSN